MIKFISKSYFSFFILALAGIIVYINILPNSMFWDDNDFILNNVFVRNFDIKHIFSENIIAGAGFISNYWRPLLSMVFATEWQLFGDWYPGYHIANILFHVVDGLLLFYILKNLFPSVRIIAFFVSLIFLIHPLQTETVAYANSLGDSLSVFFIFLGIICYLKTKEAQTSSRFFLFYTLTFISYIAGLLSKETAIVFPALLFLVDITQQERIKKMVVRLLPLFLLAALYLYLRGTILNFDNTFNFYGEATLYTESVWIRTLTFLRVLGIYFGLLVAPVHLHYERTLDVPTALFSFDIVIPIIILIALGGITLFNLLKSDFNRRYLFALGWFLIGLAPTSGIAVPINNFLYEHWLYLPQIGFFLFFGFLIHDFNMSLRSAGWRRSNLASVLTVAIGIFLIFLATQAIKRNADWRNPIGFYLQTLEFVPNSGRVWNNLGTEYAKIGELEKAKNAYLNAIPLIPQNPGPYNNIGNVFAGLGDLDTAAQYWRKSIELNPDFLPPREALLQYNMIKNEIAPGDIINIKLK